MNRKRLLFVIGTRPEAIKMAPLYLAFKEDASFETELCLTGQHRQMLDQVIRFFGVTSDFDFDLMRQNQSLNDLFARIVRRLDKILSEHHYDGVFVHGDTTTSCAAALAAFHRRRPIFHVEAGLRTYNVRSPWPEEMNRRFTGMIADVHFAPTERNKNNLVSEKVDESKVHVTGNTVIDALFRALRTIDENKTLNAALNAQFRFIEPDKKLILVTGHRRENFGSNFENICKSLQKIARRQDVQVVYPVHLNPKVREPVMRMLGEHTSIHLIEPLEYSAFVYLMRKCDLVLTDSGGLQEEAPSLGKPVLVMRDTTERPETIEKNLAKLVGTRIENIVCEVERLLDDKEAYSQMTLAENPYGDGKASQRIVTLIKEHYAN